jgi:hypothetical protein
MALAGAWLSTDVRAQSTPQEVTPRGIYVGGSRLGVNAEIEVERNGRRERVPESHEFRSGDRFWLHVTVNQDAYVYVLNRTLTGNGAASRGIKVLADADKKATAPPPNTYVLVHPVPGSQPAALRRGVATVLPGAGEHFSMDEVPGAEKLLIIASATRLDIPSYFDPSGLLTKGKNDSVGDVLNRLNGELLQAADNAATEQPGSRSIQIVPNPQNGRGQSGRAGDAAAAKGGAPPTGTPPASGTKPAPGAAAKTTPPAKSGGSTSSVGVVKKAGQPMLLELTLAHLPR